VWVIRCEKCSGTGKAAKQSPFAVEGHEWECMGCEGVGSICLFCHNAGFVHLDVPYGDPRFGKEVPCNKCNAYQKVLANMMAKFSVLPADLVDMEASFETFPRGMDGTAIHRVEAYVEAIATGKLGKRRGLILRGPNQIGKTGLAYCAHATLQKRGVTSVFVPSIVLFQRLNEAKFDKANPGRYEWLMGKLTSITHLVIDDLGAEKHTETREEDLFLLLSTRISTPNTATLVTTNLDIREMSEDEERLGKKCQLEEAIGTRSFSRLAGRNIADIAVKGRKWSLIRGEVA